MQNSQQSEFFSSIALSCIRQERAFPTQITHWWLGILYSFLDDASNFIVYVDCDEIGCLASQMLCC